MTEKEITDIFNSIRRDVHSRKLVRAMDTLIANAEQSMNWEISDKIKSLARDYSYMLDYMAAGYPDDNRIRLYRNVSERTLSLADTLQRRMLSNKSGALYFSYLRVWENSGKSIALLMSEFSKQYSASDNLFAKLTSSDAGTSDDDRSRLESTANELFNAIWTAYPLSDDDYSALRTFLSDDSNDFVWRSLFLSAVMLGELQYHDSSRLNLMSDVYESTSDLRFKAQALVGLLLSIYRHRERGIEKSVEDRLKVLKDNPSWRSDLRSAFIEFIRTSDTKRISRKMKDEIIPTMLNMRPEIMKRFENFKADLSDPEAFEINPEWEEALKASGLTDKIKQLSELQSEGGDIFMSTFAHLKRFPFFHDPAGWFMPFDAESSRVEKSLNGNVLAANTIAELPFLCDSDKYSLTLSFDMVPEAQRKMLFDQFDAQKIQFYESVSGANDTAVDDMRRHLRNYLQNLNRFLTLFRRKGEFYNPFDSGVNLLSLHILSDDFDDAETLRVIAEFFFKLGYWEKAVDVFLLLTKVGNTNDESVWQKIGYCYQNLNNIPAAIEAYSRAEMLAPQSRWLLGRLYSCHRAMGDYKLALEYARRMADDSSLQSTMTLGYALLEANEIKSALTEFQRAEFIDETSVKPLRPLAWCYFLIGDFDNSRRYYNRFESMTSGDMLNFGHLELAAGNYREAYKQYKSAIEKGMSQEQFIKNINNDSKIIKQLGVDDETIAMICDAISSERKDITPFGS